MKKTIAIFVILVIICSSATASESDKTFSVGTDIGAMNQGISIRYDSGRWFELESSFRLPVSMYIANGFDSMINKASFDPYAILSSELSITAYFTPIQIRSFSLAIGINGTAYANVNGPSIENKGTENEVHYGAGAVLWCGVKPALKLQFDFSKWGFSISGSYPVIGYSTQIGHATLGNSLTGILSAIYNSVRIGFDFKI